MTTSDRRTRTPTTAGTGMEPPSSTERKATTTSSRRVITGNPAATTDLESPSSISSATGSTSPTTFAKAAENAVATAAETVRNLKWARVAEFEIELDGKKVKTYRATLRIYFDVER